jgi:endoglucanase
LGNNPIKMSYLVGYGSLYPQRVHHRGASIPADQNPACSDKTWLNSPDRNPNVAVGALVGGPFFNETYIDKRDNAMQGEPTTTSNALFIGLLSGLISSSTAVKKFT